MISAPIFSGGSSSALAGKGVSTLLDPSTCGLSSLCGILREIQNVFSAPGFIVDHISHFTFVCVTGHHVQLEPSMSVGAPGYVEMRE